MVHFKKKSASTSPAMHRLNVVVVVVVVVVVDSDAVLIELVHMGG